MISFKAVKQKKWLKTFKLSLIKLKNLNKNIKAVQLWKVIVNTAYFFYKQRLKSLNKKELKLKL